MQARRIFMLIVIAGAAVFFLNKKMDILEHFTENPATLFFSLLILAVLAYAVKKVLSA